MNNDAINVFNAYTDALAKGDFGTVFDLFSDSIVWHMGGNSTLSGTVTGKQALQERFGEFAQRSSGSFKVITHWAAQNDCFVAAGVVSLAERGSKKLDNPGIDLFKIENGKIQEVWTFAQYQAVEDAFWDAEL